MTKASTVSKADAGSLAVSYSSFNEAIHRNSASGIRTWGRLLMADQEKTGVELIRPELIERVIQRNLDK